MTRPRGRRMRSLLSPRRAIAAVAAALVAIALAAGLFVSSSGEAEVDAAIPPSKRKPAPELAGEWLVPPPVHIRELRGRPVVVNFWASWCVPCREEAPELARFDREMRARARLVGVDFQDAEDDARAFIREFQWRFPNVGDPRGKLGGQYGLVGLPTTFVVDGNGRIARTLTGAQTYERLAAAVEEVE